MNLHISNFISYFLIGYGVLNILKIIQIRRIISFLQKKDSKEATLIFKKAHQKSTIYFPLYYLIVWLVCSILYFNTSQTNHIIETGVAAGILWTVLNALADFLIWIGIKKKYQLTWKDIYLNTQPWTALSYYTIIISPIIVAISLIVIK